MKQDAQNVQTQKIYFCTLFDPHFTPPQSSHFKVGTSILDLSYSSGVGF
jgi:hypothetical protein